MVAELCVLKRMAVNLLVPTDSNTAPNDVVWGRDQMIAIKIHGLDKNDVLRIYP